MEVSADVFKNSEAIKLFPDLLRSDVLGEISILLAPYCFSL